MEEALVASTSGALRQGWRAAVASAYAHNQAAARVAARTVDCTFVVSDNDDTTLVVTYPQGVQGRGRPAGEHLHGAVGQVHGMPGDPAGLGFAAR